MQKPGPSCARTLWETGSTRTPTGTRIREYYFSGDGARQDQGGDIWITGRVDDVISVAGHRIGAAEVEAALIAHPAVSEAAVVPIPDEMKGEAIYGFVTLKDGFKDSEELRSYLVKQVRNEVGPIATPKTIQIAEELPKTRSGKIVRRMLRKIASGSDFRSMDASTLVDPGVLDDLVKGRR